MTIKTVWKSWQKFIKPYKQQIRAFLGWLFGMLAQVTAVGVDVVETWSVKRWALALGIAALPGIMGFIKGGDDNLSDEELYDKVHSVKQARAMAGLEVTGEQPLKAAPPKP